MTIEYDEKGKIFTDIVSKVAVQRDPSNNNAYDAWTNACAPRQTRKG